MKLKIRTVLVPAILLAALAAGPASEAAVDLVVAGPGSVLAGYSTPTVLVFKGQRTDFRNFDSATHDVVSVTRGRVFCPGIRKKRLFCSQLVDFGGTAPVKGVEKLRAGDYPFYCSVHPTTMRGLLAVR